MPAEPVDSLDRRLRSAATQPGCPVGAGKTERSHVRDWPTSGMWHPLAIEVQRHRLVAADVPGRHEASV